jgi:hypothetical protein
MSSRDPANPVTQARDSTGALPDRVRGLGQGTPGTLGA